jgi:hypothetical protein
MFMILNHTFFPLCACTGKGYSAIKLYANFVFHGLFTDILFWQFRTLCISQFFYCWHYFLEHVISLNHKFQLSFGNFTLQHTVFVNSLVFHLLNFLFVGMLLDIYNAKRYSKI